MNKTQFLMAFYDALEGLPSHIKADIMSEYQDYFRVRMEQGQTEEDIFASLGDPITLSYAVKRRTGYMAKPPKRFNFIRFCFMSFVMLLFNLICILGPAMAVLGLLIGLWGAAFGMSLGGVALLAGTFVSFLQPINLLIQSQLSLITVISASVFVSSMGLLLGIGCIRMTKWSFKVLGAYAKWNVRVLLGR